jgi:hypothetical protein
MMPTEIAKQLGLKFSRSAVNARKHQLLRRRNYDEHREGFPPQTVLIAIDRTGAARVVGQLRDSAPDRLQLKRGVKVYTLTE